MTRVQQKSFKLFYEQAVGTKSAKRVKLKMILPVCLLIFWLIIAPAVRAGTVDSLSLNQAIRQVMQNHPLIDQAGQQVQAAQARSEESRSLFYPQVDALGMYTRIGPVPTLDIAGMGSFSLYPENNYDAHLGARQIVFDFGRRSTRHSLAISREQLAEDNSERVRSLLSYQTARTFYIILFLHENIRVLDEEIAALGAHLSVAEKKMQTGSATDFDVLTIRVRVANAQSEKVDVESTLQKQKIALNRMLGIPADQIINLRGDFTSPGGRLDPDSLLAVALSQRPEMLLARDAETSLEIQSNLMSLGNKPSLLASLSLGFKNGYIPDLNQAKLNWTAGVQLQVPLFDGFRTRYQTEAAQADLAAARAHSLDVREQIRSEVRQALAEIRARQEKIATSELQLEQAEQALILAKTQYEIGVITNLDLLVAQTSRHEANLQHIRALYEMILSRFALQQTIGNKIW